MTQASVWVLDMNRLADEEVKVAFKGATFGKKGAEDSVEIADDKATFAKTFSADEFVKALETQEYHKVADFDEHLHDPSKDFTNARLCGA